MDEKKIILKRPEISSDQLPGVVALPDGKKQLKLGSGLITSLISSGGMAIVYEIWNAELEVRRAVKLLKPDHTAESEDRFHLEMKITAKLHHPNIVEIYSVGKWEDQLPYIEMELIDGPTLEKVIADAGSLPPEAVTSIGIMVGRALNYAHNQSYMLYGKRYQGVIHRDLKPGNIMVAKDGTVKLMDFGIAKPMTASKHTIEGVIMGTMQYLAPEQLDGNEVDARADLYALGVVLYEMLTGTRAFPEQNLGKLVTDKLNNNYVQLTEYSTKIPTAFCNLIHRLIRCEKEKRVQDVLEFLRTLCAIHKTLTLRAPEQVIENFLNSMPRPKRMVLLKKKKNKLPVLVFFLLFFMVTFFAVVYLPTFMPTQASVVALFSKLLGKSNAQNADPQAMQSAIMRRIDSVLSTQKALAREKELAQKPILATNDSITFVNDQQPRAIAPLPKHKIKTKPLVSKKALAQIVAPGKKAEATPVSPAMTKPREEPPGLSFLEKMKMQFRTSDVMTMFSLAVESGKTSEAVQLYPMLPQDQANSKKAKMYHLRILKATNDNDGIKNFLFSNDIYDGEFYLEKARWFFNTRDYFKAEEFIKRASISPSQFLDQRQYRELLLYSRGLCLSALYDEKPGSDTKKVAMEAWFEVKSLFRNSPDHKYFQKADSEIRRISTTLAQK